MSEISTAVPFWKRTLFSAVMLEKTRSQKIAYAGVVAALCIVSNVFEFKFATVQFSLTVFTSILAGILIGPLLGACAVFVGDGVGYLVNSMGYPYYWWVALSCAGMALIAGLVMNGFRFKFKGAGYVKLAIICVLTFLICSVLVNSLGMYYIGLKLFMPTSVKEAVEARFGGELSFGIYLLIRFFILGQVYNSLFNYALLFCVVPVLNAVKPLKLNIR